MTTAVTRPRLRPQVTLGPGLRCGPRTVHRVVDRLTGCSYRIGDREHFVLRLMDGAHTMDDIAAAYADAFGKALGPDSRRQILAMLGRYQLLDGHTDDTVVARLRAERLAREEARGRRRVLARPDRLCDPLARLLAFAFRPAAVAAGLALALAGQAVVWSHYGTLVDDAAHHAPWPVAVPVLLLCLWTLVAVHETAHGVACRHFGGQVTEIGVRLRLPLLVVPYCRTDDMLLFARRTARVGTAFAGCHAVLVLVAPLTALWALLPRGGAASATVATVVLFGSGGSLLALLPFLGADGQVMLEAALGRTELGRQTWRFWTVRPRAAGYRRDDVAVHTGYGVATVLAGAAGYALLMWLWYATLRPWTGPAAAVAVLAAETAAVLAVAVLLARRRARTTRKAPDER